MERHRQVALWALMLGVGSALLVGAAEALLRASGRESARRARPVHEPLMHESDPELGWRKRPGRYRFPGYTPGSDPIEMTYLSGGLRAIRESEVADGEAPAVVLVGGSFTLGAAISDSATFAWKLQARHPELRFENRGTVGYGTYQSLLVMERRLAEPPLPRAVLYGFVGHHETRNVAHWSWLESLSRNAFVERVRVPYCTLDAAGALRRHAPTAHPRWPLAGHMALVRFLQDLHGRWRAEARTPQTRAVTKALLLQMDSLCRSKGVSFAVIFLHGPKPVRAHYSKFLSGEGIRFADCALPLEPGLRVPGEGHPGGRMNSLWADCIDELVDETT